MSMNFSPFKQTKVGWVKLRKGKYACTPKNLASQEPGVRQKSIKYLDKVDIYIK